MNEYLPLILSLLLGTLSAVIAYTHGRSPLLWFFMGALFGWIGVLVLLFLPPGDSKQKDVLEVPTINQKLKIEMPEGDWFYLDNEKRVQGPVTALFLKDKWKENFLTENSWVWQEGLATWLQIKNANTLEKWLTSLPS